MFSNLGNIFLGRPRHAENADTRLDIRRHDPEQESRRKKDESGDGKSEFDMDDSATVTVEALRVFLENFLQSMTPATQNVEKNFSVDGTAAQNESAPRHVDAENAKAMGAYGRVVQKNERPATPSTPAPDADIVATGNLSADEVRTIYALLADLQPLSDRGIEYLTIERSESFLASLVNAVEKAKQV